MTNQEALKWIDGRVLELSCLVDITSSDRMMQRINEEYNALLQSRAAIEKQIPKVPEVKEIEKPAARGGDVGVHKRTIYCCPVCNRIMYIQNHFEFQNGFKRWPIGSMTSACPTCGQAIKWEAKETENSAIDA